MKKQVKTGCEHCDELLAPSEKYAEEYRRDELAVEFFEGAYDHLPRNGYRRAIDRIIELENKN